MALRSLGFYMAASSAKAATGKLDWLKWLFVLILLVGTVVGNVYFDQYSMAVRAAAIIVVAIIMLLVAVRTRSGDAAWRFIKEARMEMRKVVWPTRQETTQTTLIVIVIVALMGLILWGVDTLFAYIVSMIIF